MVAIDCTSPGQQVVEEVLDAQRPGCPPEYFNIKIPKGHEQYDTKNQGDIELPLLRSRYDMNTGFSPNVPRQQVRAHTAGDSPHSRCVSTQQVIAHTAGACPHSR